jgi:hypothetical protein
LLFVVSCTESHSLTGGDASTDDATLDAPCPDGDGDGARDARCGGDDCDDADPHVGPHASACASPTRVRACDGAMVTEHDCAATTPDCDARTGQCAATACGDGVVHPDEQCDTDWPCYECQVCCRAQEDCTALSPGNTCVPDPSHLASVCGICVAPNPAGAPVRAACTADGDCASRYCDPEQGRCVVPCAPAMPTCEPMADAWCAHEELAFMGPGQESFAKVLGCHFPCTSDRDCPSTSACTSVYGYRASSGMFLAATCLAASGTVPFGGSCTLGVNDCVTNNCLAGSHLCTRTCLDDSDCGGPLPHCAAFPPTETSYAPGPLSPRLCAP